MPEAAELNAVLEKNRVKQKVAKIAEVEIPKADAVFELTVSGLG